MEFASNVLGSILSKAGEYLVVPIAHEIGYIFCFKSIVEEFQKQDTNLRLAQEHVQRLVDTATRNTEEIETDVQNWLTDVSNVVADVRRLEDEIKANESRLNGWCPHWGCRYKSSRRVAKKTSIMLKLRDDAGKLNNISHPTALPGIEFFKPKDFMTFESTKFAFDGMIEALKDDERNIIGLYGMGGVGKTTLAKVVGNTTKEHKMFNEVVMVVVSQTLNVMNIQDQIADSLSMKLEEKSEQGRARRLCLRLKGENKILIILDDVWTKLDLTTIGIPFGDEHMGCKILITTRVKQVCISMNCQWKVQLNVLNREEGLNLFKRHAGVGNHSLPLDGIAKEVVDECNGLPLAIVTVASLLREKDVDEWKVVCQKLRNSKLDDIENVDVDVYACLKLSYDYLKGDEIKLCFLLCSLFPEDHKIELEELVRYGLGLGLYQDADSIEEARIQLRVTINTLKAYCLLLDDGEERFAKMHDVVRDVALWITSKGDNVFMVKTGRSLREWPKLEGLEPCTAISLIDNNIQVLPNGLICPKLEILLLGAGYNYPMKMKVSDGFFKEMKALKVASLAFGSLSLNSLQFLTNLVSLQLINCSLDDVSFIKKLKRLEILSFRNSNLVELPEELGELSKLRMLDLMFCGDLERFPFNTLSRLPRLEELYIGNNFFSKWGVEGNASLSELNKLSHLVIVALSISSKCLPQDFAFQNLIRYEIRVNANARMSYPTTTTLRIKNVEMTSFFAFKALFQTTEHLELEGINGCQNVVPNIDQRGLKLLNSLQLKNVPELEYIIDMTQQQVPDEAFSNLTILSLHGMSHLREICSGRSPSMGFLENLVTLYVHRCESMSSLFPSMLLQRLKKLEDVVIEFCSKLQNLFGHEGLWRRGEEKHPLLSSLKILRLSHLFELTCIWKGPTLQHVSLQSLTQVKVTRCNKLIYLFTLSLCRSLMQLEELEVGFCERLECIITVKAEGNALTRGRNDIVLPKLKKLILVELANLSSFCPKNCHSSWPSLHEAHIEGCPNLKTPIVAKS